MTTHHLTLYGFSQETLQTVLKLFGECNQHYKVRLIQEHQHLEVPQNIEIVPLAKLAKFFGTSDGRDLYLDLLEAKQLLPDKNGDCILNVANEPASLSLCMYLLKLLIENKSFDRLVVVYPKPSVLFDLIIFGAGADRLKLDQILEAKKFGVFFN